MITNMSTKVILREPTAGWDSFGDAQIRADLIREPDVDNVSELYNYLMPVDLSTTIRQIGKVAYFAKRNIWIGLECFPAKELWMDDNGYMLIESPGGTVYVIESINIDWIEEEDN